jgi:acyl-CoA reductase-like NAD-dependent aldehyde dehydrogenase
MAAAAGSNLKRVSLELGGKSPTVLADADLDQAIKGATWAVFSSTGQECIAGSRLFVEKPIYQQVVDGLAAQAQRIRVGPGFAPTVHIGPIVSEKQLQTILGYIDNGWQVGAEIVAGGERLGGELAGGYFVGPTVVTHQDNSLKLVQEEMFGPVVAVTSFASWDEMIQRANQTAYVLAAGLDTRREQATSLRASGESRHAVDQQLRPVRPGRTLRRLQRKRLRPRDGQENNRVVH